MEPGEEVSMTLGALGGFFLVVPFAAGGLHFAGFAGACAHGAWGLVPPAYGFGRVVEGGSFVVVRAFVVRFGAFIVFVGTDAGGAGVGMAVPPPVGSGG